MWLFQTRATDSPSAGTTATSAASVESHLLVCGPCRSAIGEEIEETDGNRIKRWTVDGWGSAGDSLRLYPATAIAAAIAGIHPINAPKDVKDVVRAIADGPSRLRA